MSDQKSDDPVSGDQTQTSANTERPALVREALPPHYRIYLEEVGEEGEPLRRFRLEKGRTVIGRQASDIVFDDPLLSRKHAAVEVYNEEYVLVRDLASTNGTFVNDHLVTHAKIERGDAIRAGRTHLRLIVEKGV